MEVLLRRFPGLAGLPHVDLGVRPTPVEERRIGGLAVLVKRDDRTSDLYGGNKVRALEFLLAGAPRRVLTFSSLSAHHAYATAFHARRLGIPCDAVIVRKGQRGRVLEALPNVAERISEVDGVLGAAAAALGLWRPGTRVIRPGGLSLRGTLGYVEAALELEDVPARIYVPMGTGTTVSGLLAGLMLRDARTEVVAVRVADPFVSFRPLLWCRAFGAIALLRRYDPTVPRVSPGGVTLRIVKGGGHYGEATRAATAAIAAAGDLELEPTYTGKTLAVLLADRAAGALLLNTYCPYRAWHKSSAS
jgi:1-aminocyclopropane-1-carboxylate deaminase/D-cysteine desulfhydrase-like pyridoxal-dependent ACC family enzyme